MRGFTLKAKKRLATIAASLAVGIAAILATPSTASASGQGYVYANTVARICPWDGCSEAYVTQYDAWMLFDCWIDSTLAPYNRFFKVSGNAGYIRTSQVYSQPSLPHC